jgi:putative restriction endonuclease
MLDRPTAAIPLDRETLVARFDGIRQFARGGRRAPHKPLLLLYALARLKHDRQTEIRFNATEAVLLQPLLRSYGPGAVPRTSRTPTAALSTMACGGCPTAPT